VLSKIARKVQWLAAQCAMVAVVALATNLFESAGALTSQSAVVTQPKPVTIVDRSRKGDRLAPAAPAILVAFPPGCESTVSFLAKGSPSNLVGRCVT
jgi:hypothetical protein